ncbi:MAG: RlmF-related methyltransferase [Candidatus Thorarchaeota archaeon]
MDSKFLDTKKYSLPLIEVEKFFPEFKNCFIPGTKRLDLSNHISLSKYNEYLFKILDDLEIKIPNGHLIPTAGLHRAVVDFIMRNFHPKSILEIGTGTTAIISQLFALRGVKVYGTEIDPISLQWALKNVDLNKKKFNEEITLYLSPGGIIKWLWEKKSPIFPLDGLICFPPYYSTDFKTVKKEKGFMGTNYELYSDNYAEKFSIDLIKEVFDLKDKLKFEFLSLIWKNEKSYLNAVRELENYGLFFDNCLIKTGTRKRIFTVINFN